MALQDSDHPVFREWLRQYVIHACTWLGPSDHRTVGSKKKKELTPLVVRRDIFGADVGCHGHDGHVRIDCPDIYSCRYAITFGHYDIHENKVIPVRIGVELVGRLFPVFLQRTSAFTSQELSTSNYLRRTRRNNRFGSGISSRFSNTSCRLRRGTLWVS